MTLFVVLGLVAVVVGVLVAVALGVRSMRAEGGEDDWDSPVGDSEFADPEDLGHSIRRGGERGRGGSAGARRPAVAGSATATDPGFDPGFRQVTPDEVPAPRAPVGPAPSVAPVASARPGRRHSQQKDQPKKRHSQRKDQPKRPARPPRLRGGDAGKDWNTTNWERVSDEDYWAEMSADKPLASRTAQSAADLRPGEPEASKERDTRTDPKLSQPERQTAAMAMPGVASSRRYEAAGRAETGGAELDAASLPVRRSGSSTDSGRMVPAASAQAAHSGADYAAAGVSGAYYSVPPAAPPSYSTQSGYSAVPGGYPGSAAAGYPADASYPAPVAGYQTPSHGMSQPGMSQPPAGLAARPSRPDAPVGQGPPAGYGADTPGYGMPTDPGYVANSSYDGSRRGEASTPYGPPGGYATTYAGYPATPSTGPAGTHAHPGAAPASGYASQPAGGFASGYLSSSALSARQRLPEPDPEPLADAGSGNPYGSYVTGPPPGDGLDAASPYGRTRPDAPDYDDHRSRGGYGNYGGGAHR